MPSSAQTAYRSGAACPLLSTNRSESGERGWSGSRRIVAKNKAATRSAAEAALVGCPLPAAVVARIDSIRSRVATSSRDWRSPSGNGIIRLEVCKADATDASSCRWHRSGCGDVKR